MTASFHILALALPVYLRIGPWQVPAFGLITTLGIVLALFASQRTALQTGLAPDTLWNAGVIAIVSAFMVSRALLIVMNPRTFLNTPLLVVAQPSLTIAGLLLTALVVWYWLRRDHLPLRQVADAWAVPALLLAAALQIAHFVEGTGLGMPTSLPWGIVPRGGHEVRLHPVQLYAAFAYLALAAFLFQRQQLPSRFRGEFAALALAAGGAVAFLFGFLRLPYDLLGHGWLDPGQWFGITAILAGVAFLPLSTPAQAVPLQEAH